MTAPRRPRSAWLPVGSTPGSLAKVQSAGQPLSRFLAKVRWRRLRALLARRLLEQCAQLLLERGDTLKQAAAVSVPAELTSGGEQPCGDLKAGGAELLLGAEPLAEQRLRLAAVAIGGDAKDRGAAGERSPEACACRRAGASRSHRC